MRPPKDTLQANGVEGQQVLFMQQPAHTQHILLPSVQYLPNRAVATTQQQIQAGGLWIGVTQPNVMYFQPNQPFAQATFPIGAAASRYVGPMYTQVQTTNLNYALLEMDPATTLSARPNYVVHHSNLPQCVVAFQVLSELHLNHFSFFFFLLLRGVFISTKAYCL
jgi:hypothetical protein